VPATLSIRQLKTSMFLEWYVILLLSRDVMNKTSKASFVNECRIEKAIIWVTQNPALQPQPLY